MKNPASLANATGQAMGFAPKDGKHCVKCRSKFRKVHVPNGSLKPGDCYSQAGWTEATKMSGLCEVCFDDLFGGDQ